MKIVLFGAPGVGKGTQAAIISDKLNIPSIATGNILRAAVKEGTELGKAAKSVMDSGGLVSDDIIIGMIKERVAQPDCQEGYILDGMPRTIPQAQALDDHGIGVDIVVSLEMPDKAIEERMAGRRTCSECSSTFHVVSNPPKQEEVCDKCGGHLVLRDDDKPETVSNRLKTFHESTEPLKDYYIAQGKLKSIDARGGLSEMTELIFQTLGMASEGK